MSGDGELLEALVAEHGEALFSFALRATADRCRAEDIVQETLLRAWQHPSALDGTKGSPRAWLLTVARNLMADAWRADARSRRADQRVVLDQMTTGVDEVENVVESWALAAAMARLTPEHREVLQQCVWGGRSVAEAARALGIPEGTVKSRTYYALRSLRLILEETGFWK